ncbi:glycosyltransferase family 4 protein [Enterococcus faecalis]|uniref:Glycosyltransferase, group 1 family protein n=1 Tax=Enterococcus faecalis RP2S-4 TaxID=1244145 RepID=A0ABC9TNL2_ENTFL|nr:glycosyltransferase family 4 protein [Enterococcus faecalis]EPI12589.1 glycosyltransferase, group 1 family protein [Enterococcus faecalis RP2S-4]
MGKTIWILNHYATNMYIDKGGRHYWIAKELLSHGYTPVIFCASTLHFGNEDIHLSKEKITIKKQEGITFVFVKCSEYQKENVKARVKNMIDFAIRVVRYGKKLEKPDIVYASSAHPLTLISGIRLSKYFKIPCISEVRDLWPESIVAYSKYKKDSWLIRCLYRGEHWIYSKSDKIIMTWEGGIDYVKNQGWSNIAGKIIHIGNGVCLEDFDNNVRKFPYQDNYITDKNYINLVYTGSLNKVNNINFLVDVATELSKKKSNIRLLIYGDGNELVQARARKKSENIFFLGRVDKKFIPSIVSQANINILHNQSTLLDIYGQSQNKLFEYLAAGNPILQTYTTNYSILGKYQCGVSAQTQSVDAVVNLIGDLSKNKEIQTLYGENARKAAEKNDFKLLTKKVIDMIEKL